MTGLLNRREFEKRLEQALDGSRNYAQNHVLCFIDLDHFKPVNDTCGHIAGDELLRQMGKLRQSSVRKSDIVARLGGDEFGILLHQCPLDQGHSIAQTICDTISAFQFTWQEQVFTIGASIGLVSLNAQSPPLAAVIHRTGARSLVASSIHCEVEKRYERF